MSKKGHLTFKKRALNIWSRVRLHPMHPIKCATGSIFFMPFCHVGFPFLCCLNFCSGCFRQVLFQLGDKKVVAGRVRKVVVLYSNDCMEIYFDGLSICRFRRVVIL